MRYYSEKFKKAVVKKVLSPGFTKKNVCKKLNVSESNVTEWIRKYRDEIEPSLINNFLDAVQPEPEEDVDIDKLLVEYDRKDFSEDRIKDEEIVEKIIAKGKCPSTYKDNEKYVIVNKIRSLKPEEHGIFLRRAGIHTDHIKQWEEELLDMAKKEIDKSDYIKQLEKENKRLQKQLKESDKEKKELKILISLKKDIRIFSKRTRKVDLFFC